MRVDRFSRNLVYSPVVSASELKVYGTYFRRDRNSGRHLLFGRTAPVIGEISFHRRHPPMARPNETHERESLNRIIHISFLTPLTESHKSSC